MIWLFDKSYDLIVWQILGLNVDGYELGEEEALTVEKKIALI